MPRKRQTKVGRLDPVDVRSKSDVTPFESLLGRGPLTIVLVYADWCGHCQTFKEKMWNEVNASPNKNINTASVHYDMVDNTSLKNSKIDGYPSLLLVGTNKKPASFSTDEGTTNAMPPPQSVNELKNMVNTPIQSPIANANSVANTVLNNAKNAPNTVVNTTANNIAVNNTAVNSITTNNNANLSSMTVKNNTNNVVNSNVNASSTLANNAVATYEPEAAENLSVPDTSLDLSTRNTVGNGTNTTQKGGSETLFTALTRITAEAGHVGALLLAATEYSDLAKRFTRRLKKRSKKTAKRKQRR